MTYKEVIETNKENEKLKKENLELKTKLKMVEIEMSDLIHKVNSIVQIKEYSS